jgi:hypothetical protein
MDHRTDISRTRMLPNPFKADIFPDGLAVTDSGAVLHPAALDELQAMLHELTLQPPSSSAEEGRVVLLKAPRAGYGKSHLLALLQQRLGTNAQIVAPQLAREGGFRWAGLFAETLSVWHEHHGSNALLTKLDELTRQVFGWLNAELIRTQRVPCANPTAAIHALRQRSLELFDLNDSRQAVGRWFVDHFERLLPITSATLGNFTGMSQEAAVTWLRALCSYAQGAAEGDLMRFEQLRWALQQGNGSGVMAGGMQILTAPKLDESFYQNRLTELFRLAALVMPLVLVFDDLDGVHGESPAVMQVARTITELRRLLPRALIILSVNQDLWAGSFQKFLPSALEDRLSSDRIQLRDLSAEQGIGLLRQRLLEGGISAAEAKAFIEAVQLPQWFAREPGRLASARSLLRHASRAWEEWQRRPQPVAPAANTAAAPERPSEPVSELPQISNLSDTLQHAGGTGTSFHQLKLMLEKLRLERIANGKPPMQVSESGTIYHDPEPSAPETATLEDETPSINTQFALLRQRLLEAKALRIDPDLFGHLLGVGGKRLAVVKASHIPVPGSIGPGAMLWQTPNGEIIFGTEPHQDRAYWQALLAHVRQRQTLSPSHLAVFSAAQEPVDLQWWLSPEEILVAQNCYLDVITLEPDALATLYAADELIHASEHNTSHPHTPDEVFAAVAAPLEGFWKRLLKGLNIVS